MPSLQQKRKLHIDLIRILAAFLVIYNHTMGQQYFMNYTNSQFKVTAVVFLSSMVKNNVPLFFMISGALLLGREESYRKLFSVRIVRIAALLVLASVMFYCLVPRDVRSVSDFLRDLVANEIAVAYWFLYGYLSMLLALPFLRKIARDLRFSDILLLIAGRFLFLTLPKVSVYLATYLRMGYVMPTDHLSMLLALTDIFYFPLIGFYVENRISQSKLTPRTTAALAAVFLGATAISVGFTMHEGIYRGIFTEEWLNMLCYITAPALYLLVRKGCSLLPESWTDGRLGKVLQAVGSLTLGIYLLDPVIRTYCYSWVETLGGDSLMLVPLSAAYSLLSMVICGCITWALKKLPVLKQLL